MTAKQYQEKYATKIFNLEEFRAEMVRDFDVTVVNAGVMTWRKWQTLTIDLSIKIRKILVGRPNVEDVCDSIFANEIKMRRDALFEPSK